MKKAKCKCGECVNFEHLGLTDFLEPPNRHYGRCKAASQIGVLASPWGFVYQRDSAEGCAHFAPKEEL